MRKLIALIMALTMIAALAACGTTEDGEKTDDTTTTVDTTEESTEQTTEGSGDELPGDVDTTTANDIMNDVWGKIPADQKPAVIGGHYSNEFTDGPAAYDLGFAEDLAATLLIPDDQMDKVIDASTAVHLMNANTMTVGIVRLAEGSDMQAFADAVYDRITNNQWMCGFPEKLIISQIHEDYVLIAFGAEALLDSFEKPLDESWTNNDFYNEAMQ